MEHTLDHKIFMLLKANNHKFMHFYGIEGSGSEKY